MITAGMMKMLVRGLLVAALLCTTAHAFFPEPVKRSEAETQIAIDLERAETDLDRVQIARRYLRNHPDDVPVGRAAQNVLIEQLDQSVEFFRIRHEQHRTLASFYLFARATDFALPEEEVEAVMNQHRDGFWAWLLYMATEWHKTEPDMAAVIDRAETAVTLDGSRPEGYLFLSLAYMEVNRLKDAREALEAGLVCDPLNENFRHTLLDVYLQQRDADAYFKMMTGTIPPEPVEVDLAAMDESRRVTTQDLHEQVSMLVYWSAGSDICIHHELQQLNKVAIRDNVPYPIYAMQLEGDHAVPETDRSGNAWRLQFLKPADEMQAQLQTPKRPCVYVVGADGFVHALVHGKGHREDLVETVIWLAGEVARRQ